MADLNLHTKLILELKETLVECGIPENAIATDIVLHFPKGNRSDADVVIFGDDHKTIISQFEVKLGPSAYNRAEIAMRYVLNRHKCYVVTSIDGESVISLADNAEGPNWIKLSDKKAICQLLGDYYVESSAAVTSAEERKHEIVSREWNGFRWAVGILGAIVVIGAVAFELKGYEFSWKVYFLLLVFIALFAATSGYVVHIKVGENEVSIEKKKSVS